MQSIGYWIQQHVLLMFAIGIIICNFIWLLFCRKQLNIKWAAALLIAILHDIVGYTAMRLLAIIEVGGDSQYAPVWGSILVATILLFWSKVI